MIIISRKRFLKLMGIAATYFTFSNGINLLTGVFSQSPRSVVIEKPLDKEDIFSFIRRVKGKMVLTYYRQILGAGNSFKEGDKSLGLAAKNEESRQNARTLISNTTLKDLNRTTVYQDDLLELIHNSTALNKQVQNWTIGELKSFVLSESETSIKEIMPSLTSDVIACLVKTFTNNELIAVGQKVFNPLPRSKIGSKGYMSARVQPNSPTDNIDDITWQVFNAWSYAVGDLLLGTNPVSSDPDSIAKIEHALHDILVTFDLEEVMPNCVLSHIDIQVQVEEVQPGTTGIWFQSLGGTVAANQTFDVTIEKMIDHVNNRDGLYGLYVETGQGADFTNGHGEGFDMVMHESRKYGFVRALKKIMSESKAPDQVPWVFVNDVAGFIGPEVFRNKEQLVRCCLEDIVMGKLHGLTIGLDICSTLHMDITLDDLDWCIEKIMPANPAYLMALPTKNDPMLSYLTTAFNNHIRIREEFGYKVNDDMWEFFKKLKILDEDGKPTEHFGDPIWIYYQHRLAKNDKRSRSEIYKEGRNKLEEIRNRGVPIAEGYGKNIWDLDPELDKEVRRLYEDAKVSIWTEMNPEFVASISASTAIITQSKDRVDYVYHPGSGEELNNEAVLVLKDLRNEWKQNIPDVQIIISDGLNVRALTDEGHLYPFLNELTTLLNQKNYIVSPNNVVITHGRVRAGYECGRVLFGRSGSSVRKRSILHIIGERPGSGHHNFSVYLTVAPEHDWYKKGQIDHNISRVVSGISDTALIPEKAINEIVNILGDLYEN